jgi:hypothetical protein
MVETFTPAVCGSRKRQRLALALFAVGALAASAMLGALLGLAGEALGARRALIGVAALALLAAAREAGVVSLPLPQARRQVPERWRVELPLPLWSLGYGTGLGAGFLTFQPVATFWVACAGAVALADPLAAAVCLTLFGLGRSFMAAAAPLRSRRDPTSLVEALVRRRRTLARANAVGLALVAVLIFAAPGGAATRKALMAGLDPSVSGRVLAYAELYAGVSRVVVRPPSVAPVVIEHARSPSIDGELVAYVDDAGIHVVNWRTQEELALVTGIVSKPALDWPLLAFKREGSSSEAIVLADLRDPAAPVERRIARTARSNDLGRPSLVGGRLAWHRVTQKDSRIFVYTLATGRLKIVARTRIGLLANPSVTRYRVLWVDERSTGSRLLTRRLDRRRVQTLWSLKGRDRLFWTTALTGRSAYVTRWYPSTRSARLVRVDF